MSASYSGSLVKQYYKSIYCIPHQRFLCGEHRSQGISMYCFPVTVLFLPLLHVPTEDTLRTLSSIRTAVEQEMYTTSMYSQRMRCIQGLFSLWLVSMFHQITVTSGAKCVLRGEWSSCAPPWGLTWATGGKWTGCLQTAANWAWLVCHHLPISCSLLSLLESAACWQVRRGVWEEHVPAFQPWTDLTYDPDIRKHPASSGPTPPAPPPLRTPNPWNSLCQ